VSATIARGRSRRHHPRVLVCVKTRLDPKLGDLSALEAELVRRGARDAHLTEDGRMSIMVAARSAGEGAELVRALVRQVAAASARPRSRRGSAPPLPTA
jgi:hypothetical protein